MSRNRNKNFNCNEIASDVSTESKVSGNIYAELENNGRPVVGVVTNCNRLNIRKEPNLEAEVLSIVVAGSTLNIDHNKCKPGWVAVRTEDGINGYCMTEYVNFF